MPSSVTARVDLAALRHNLARVKALTPKANVMAVIKADGYGHGMEHVATALASADEFAVRNLAEATRLRAAGCTAPISCLSAQFSAADFERSDEHTRFTIFDHSQIDVLESVSSSVQRNIWLKVDTGMGRLGFSLDEVSSVIKRLTALPCVSDIGLMTHLANADAPENPRNLEQLERAKELSQRGWFSETSVLNSAGVCGFAEHAFDRVRPGLMLYGASPLIGHSAASLGLQTVMTLSAPVISVRSCPAGSFVGYGDDAPLKKTTRVAVVGCGYGDGYPRHAGHGTSVVINGQSVTLLGRVSMDMMSVDIGDANVRIGDEATLWGANNPIEKVAATAGTIAYSLMSGLTPRVQREYING